MEQVHDQFERVFKTHFKSLLAYAHTILNDPTMSEEIVQEVFYKLWEQREQIDIHSSLKAYLYRSVHNESLNHIKHQKVKAVYRQYTLHHESDHTEEHDPIRKLSGIELENKIRHALNELPEQCRLVFQLSRFESMKYQEIAGHLNISVKTVENQMGKALKRLRVSLEAWLPLLTSSLIFILNQLF